MITISLRGRLYFLINILDFYISAWNIRLEKGKNKEFKRKKAWGLVRSLCQKTVRTMKLDKTRLLLEHVLVFLLFPSVGFSSLVLSGLGNTEWFGFFSSSPKAVLNAWENPFKAIRFVGLSGWPGASSCWNSNLNSDDRKVILLVLVFTVEVHKSKAK